MDTTKDALKNAPGIKYDSNKTTWVPENPSSSNRLLTLEAPEYRSLYVIPFSQHDEGRAPTASVPMPAFKGAPLFGAHAVCSRAADPPTM